MLYNQYNNKVLPGAALRLMALLLNTKESIMGDLLNQHVQQYMYAISIIL